MGEYVYVEGGQRGFTDLKGKAVPMKRATSKSAGYDLYATRSLTIFPNSVTIIPTGLKVFMPSDEVFMLFPRSSLAIKRNLILKNVVGVIDADYDEEILVALWNTGKFPENIMKGDRIAQGVFLKYLTCGDKPTNIRKGGIGSTGV